MFIVGLPRTGTTKLHRLLSRYPRFYWMPFWESQMPVPLHGEALDDPSPRIAQGAAIVQMMRGTRGSAADRLRPAASP